MVCHLQAVWLLEDYAFELHKYSIEPIVIIYHNDFPLRISRKYKEFISSETMNLYAKYCETIFKHYKGEVKYLLNFNDFFN